MRLRFMTLALVCLAGAGGRVTAQEVSAGVRGGVTIPAGSYGDSASSLGTGWSVGLVGRADFDSSHFSVQLDAGYSANSIEGPPYGTVSDWQAGLGLVYRVLPASANLRPYVLLGGGVDYWQDNSGNGLTPALYGSAGFDLRLDPIMPYAEIQYRNVLTPGSNLKTIQLIFGLRYVVLAP
ncbi:MAG: hypothetical protein H6Q77_1103 [Gemmatimonadetes bacterium]|jgi:hypothetical protein|nr:hypothetical protein [Gemmatimonadota bacterium]